MKHCNWLTIHFLPWCLGYLCVCIWALRTVYLDADLLSIALAHPLCCYAEVILRKMMNYTPTPRWPLLFVSHTCKKPTKSHELFSAEFHQNEMNIKKSDWKKNWSTHRHIGHSITGLKCANEIPYRPTNNVFVYVHDSIKRNGQHAYTFNHNDHVSAQPNNFFHTH